MKTSWELFLNENNIGSVFRNVKLQNVVNLHPEKEVYLRAFLKNPRSLLLYGAPGRGKSYTTLAIIKELLRTLDFHQIRFQKAKTIDDTILQKSMNNESCGSYTSVLCNATYLFIDDFGVDRSNDRTSRDMYEIIDSRWANQLPTIISTNLKPKEIETFYGERIASRLKSFQKLYFSGNDLREQ